jgi:hypothetical protein
MHHRDVALESLHCTSTVDMSELDPELFAGVLSNMGPPSDPNPSLEELNQQAVQDDLDGEKETVAVDEGNTNLMELLSTVNEVSKGVSDGTHAEYRRYVVSPAGPIRI